MYAETFSLFIVFLLLNTFKNSEDGDSDDSDANGPPVKKSRAEKKREAALKAQQQAKKEKVIMIDTALCISTLLLYLDLPELFERKIVYDGDSLQEKPRQMLEKPIDPAVQAELIAQQERQKVRKEL